MLAALVVWTDQRSDLGKSSATPHLARFELTDYMGAVRTQEDFAGQWMLVFIGFANCLDVCPTAPADIAALMEQIGPGAPKVQPLSIPIDPDRDMLQSLTEFIPRFEAGERLDKNYIARLFSHIPAPANRIERPRIESNTPPRYA